MAKPTYTTKLRNQAQSALSNKRISAEQLISAGNEALADYIDQAVEDTDNIKLELKGVQSTVKNVKEALKHINTLLINKTSTTSNPSVPVSEPPISQPSQNTTTEDTTDAVRDTIARVVPPLFQESEKRQEKSGFVTNLFKKLNAARRNDDRDYENKKRKSLFWNKEAADSGYNADKYGRNKRGLAGNIANKLTGGITESPFAKIIKFILSPAGMILLYTIGKLFKKFIWDPYIKPVTDWFNNDVKPLLLKLGGYIGEVGQWIAGLFPKWDVVKNSFNEFMNALNDPNATIYDKIVQGLKLADNIFAPITNMFRAFIAKVLQFNASILSKIPGLGDIAKSQLQSAKDVIDSMKDSKFKETELQLLKDSEVGQKYKDVFTPKTPEEQEKEKNRFKPSALAWVSPLNMASEKYIHESNKPQTVRMTEGELKRRGDETKSFNQARALKSARLKYEAAGNIAADQALKDLSTKKFKDENEALKYMKDLPENYKDLMKSSEGQNEVLKLLVEMLTKQNLRTNETQKALNDLSMKSWETKQTNINMFSPSEPPVQRPLTPSNRVY